MGGLQMWLVDVAGMGGLQMWLVDLAGVVLAIIEPQTWLAWAGCRCGWWTWLALCWLAFIEPQTWLALCWR
jgi:hypothetical protein